MKTKTASVRLPKEMYEEIDNICDGIGCSRNDWIKDTLQDKLREENSQDQEEKPIPEAKVIKMSDDDGKTWYDVTDNSDKPIHEVEI